VTKTGIGLTIGFIAPYNQVQLSLSGLPSVLQFTTEYITTTLQSLYPPQPLFWNPLPTLSWLLPNSRFPSFPPFLPVCFEYFQEPILMCTNGHSVCGECKAKLERCLVCRSDILETRNRALEAVMRELKSCMQEYELAMANITAHEGNCHLCPYKCPIAECA
jgi:hypothetical protein